MVGRTRKQRGGDIFNIFRPKVIPPPMPDLNTLKTPPIPDLNTLKKGEIDLILLALTTDLKQNMENCYKECESIITDDGVLNQAKSQLLSGYALQFMNTCNMYYSMPGNEGVKTKNKKCDFIRPRLYIIEELYNKALSLLKQLTPSEDDTYRKEVFEEIIAKIKQIFIQSKIYHPTINNDPLLKVHQQPGSRALSIPVSIEVGGENVETAVPFIQGNSANRRVRNVKQFNIKNTRKQTYTKAANRRIGTLSLLPPPPPLGKAELMPNLPLNPEQLGEPKIMLSTNDPNATRSAFSPTSARRGAGRKTKRRRRNQS